MDAPVRRRGHSAGLLLNGLGWLGVWVVVVVSQTGCASQGGLLAQAMPVPARDVIATMPARNNVGSVALGAMARDLDAHFESHHAYVKALVLPVELVIHNAGPGHVVVHGPTIVLELGDGSRYSPVLREALREGIGSDVSFASLVYEALEGPDYPFTGQVVAGVALSPTRALASLAPAFVFDLVWQGIKRGHAAATASRRERRKRNEAALERLEEVALGQDQTVDVLLYFCLKGSGLRGRLAPRLSVEVTDGSRAESSVVRLPVKLRTEYVLELMGVSSSESLERPGALEDLGWKTLEMQLRR